MKFSLNIDDFWFDSDFVFLGNRRVGFFRSEYQFDMEPTLILSPKFSLGNVVRKYKFFMAVALVFTTVSTTVVGIHLFQREEPEEKLSAVNGKPEPLTTPFINRKHLTPSIQMYQEPTLPFSDIPEDIAEAYVQTNANESYPTFVSRYLDINSRRPGYFKDYEQLLSAVNSLSMWEVTNQLDSAQDLLDKLKIKDPELLRFSPKKLESLVVGDLVDIPIKQAGKTYQMHVESIRSEADGDITWRGYIQEDEQKYYVSFTRNASGLTIGGVTTPQGHFTLEAHEDIGWISASQTSFHNSAETDVVFPHDINPNQANN